MKTLVFLILIFISFANSDLVPKKLPIDSFEPLPLKTSEILPQPHQLLGIHAIYENPVLVLLKNDTTKNEFTGFFLENGLKNIYENTNTRILHQELYSDVEKRGFLVRPEKITSSLFKEWSIKKLILPENINLAEFNDATKGINSFCYLIILKDEDLPRIDLPVHQVDDFIINEQNVEINKSENYSLSRSLVKEMPPIPIPVEQIPSYIPLFSTENNHQPLLSLPLYPADTFPYIPDTKYPFKMVKDKETMVGV